MGEKAKRRGRRPRGCDFHSLRCACFLQLRIARDSLIYSFYTSQQLIGTVYLGDSLHAMIFNHGYASSNPKISQESSQHRQQLPRSKQQQTCAIDRKHHQQLLFGHESSTKNGTRTTPQPKHSKTP
ncbi:hypothetical protein MTR_7g498240 [Medicago truncatula]|uniref:Uncharacterized protein n=1 Tax=Medicago truncatula TaxID=3880 RepID=A0A072U2Q2_MEDTR|nr:hypothetical protein MTR_7g498240 [Medicago truncatula]